MRSSPARQKIAICSFIHLPETQGYCAAMTSKLIRAATVTAATVFTLASAATTFPASAEVRYWAFKNVATGTCLTGSATTSAVYVADCQNHQNQHWQWVGDSPFRLLMNRQTKRCMTTDSKSRDNKVWSSMPCEWVSGQRWRWSETTLTMWSHYNSELRTSPTGSASVYATERSADFDDELKWRASPPY